MALCDLPVCLSEKLLVPRPLHTAPPLRVGRGSCRRGGNGGRGLGVYREGAAVAAAGGSHTQQGLPSLADLKIALGVQIVRVQIQVL